MKKLFNLVFLLLCLLTPDVMFAQDTPIISVLDFKASGISKVEAEILVDYISSHIVESGKYIVIDRMQRETILEEIEFSASDCVDEKCQIELGRLLLGANPAERVVCGQTGAAA